MTEPRFLMTSKCPGCGRDLEYVDGDGHYDADGRTDVCVICQFDLERDEPASNVVDARADRDAA